MTTLRILTLSAFLSGLFLVDAQAAIIFEHPVPPPNADGQTGEPSSTEARRGGMVTLKSDPQNGTFDDVTVFLCRIPAGNCRNADRKPALVTDRGTGKLTFQVPYKIELGRYQVHVAPANSSADSVPPPVGELRVVTPAITTESVIPTTPYREGDPSTYVMTVSGSGFSAGEFAWENRLLISGMPPLIMCRTPKTTGTGTGADVGATPDASVPPASCTPGFTVWADDDGRMLRFSGIPESYTGVRDVSVRVGDTVSNKTHKVTFALVGRWVPLWATFAVFAVLAYLTWRMVRGPKLKTVCGQKVSRAYVLFLDEQTNTFSLSKFQFYLWMGSALIGYLYLSFAKSWVQGNIEFSNVPAGLSVLLGTAAGTSLLSTGVSNVKGGKGQGQINPRWSDFVTQGDVVAPERLQYFLWTIVGAFWFLLLALGTPPSDIQTLPSIPSEFLTLTGISALGYIGGKVVRPAGPRITSIAAKATASNLDLTVTGSGLSVSPTAILYIDTAKVTPDQLTDPTPPSGSGPAPAKNPALIEGDKEAGESDYATKLQLTLYNVPPGWLTGTHDFTIVNPDGQKAVAQYSLPNAGKSGEKQPPSEQKGDPQESAPDVGDLEGHQPSSEKKTDLQPAPV